MIGLLLADLLAWLLGTRNCATAYCRNSGVVPFHRHDGTVVWRCFTCARWARDHTDEHEETLR